MMKWQPIETAPRNRDVLVFVPMLDPPQVVAGLFDNGEEEGWSSALREMEFLDKWPTHWMPLPPSPNDQ